MSNLSELQIVRRIRGSVHGSIEITALEDKVLDHWMVQRLRRIKQLAFLSFVFPGATHSRFEHSLGVMHLAGISWDRLFTNQKRLAVSCAKYKDFEVNEKRSTGGLVHGLLSPTFLVLEQVFNSAYAKQALRLAGLLHDLGHPPFSHSGERFLPSWAEVARNSGTTSEYLQSYLDKKCASLKERGKDPETTFVRHEIYTILMVDQLLKDIYGTTGRDLSLKVSPRDVVSIIVPEIGPEPGSPLAAYGTHKLCNELISGEFDLDRMDYLLRDSRECGVVYGIFDSTRILDSLCVYHDPLDSSLHLAIAFSGLAAFEDYLGARYSMYLQVYFHKTGVAAEAMLKNLTKQLDGFTLPTDVNEYAQVDEYNIDQYLKLAAAKIIQNQSARETFNSRVDNLLKNRRLWKRVYEISARKEPPEKEFIDHVMSVVRQDGTEVELISSSNSLTNFKPRDPEEVSHNYLRLIKKDELQFPRVVPIEDHTSVVGKNTRNYIVRLYVEDSEDSEGRSIPAKIKQKLTENLRT